MKIAIQEAIQLTQGGVRRWTHRLNDFVRLYWEYTENSQNSLEQKEVQRAALEDVGNAIDEVVAKLEILKEKMQ
jgi:hypothetical protein